MGVLTGPRLLVAPVGELGAKTRDVYLPKLDKSQPGGTWRHWYVTPQLPIICTMLSTFRWTDRDFGPGGKSVSVNAPLDQIPVFYLGNKEDILNGDI